MIEVPERGLARFWASGELRGSLESSAGPFLPPSLMMMSMMMMMLMMMMMVVVVVVVRRMV